MWCHANQRAFAVNARALFGKNRPDKSVSAHYGASCSLALRYFRGVAA
jgi:hypothetical protein